MASVRYAVFTLALIASITTPLGNTGSQAVGDDTPPENAVENATTAQPNFVLVVTDDQRWDTIGRCLPELDPFDFDAGADACMPNLQSLLMSGGTTFLNGNVTQSLCCPSRASILTGQYSESHGVTYNNGVLLDEADRARRADGLLPLW